jgi:histidinol-phosphate aminotransferase
MVSRRHFLGSLGLGIAAGATRLRGSELLFTTGPEPQRGEQFEGIILLNNNENPYGPSERVLTTMRDALIEAHRYPDEAREELVRRIATEHSVKTSQVLLGCGSTEILRATASAFLGRGKKLMVAKPTFEAITDYAKAADAEVISVPINRGFAHDLNGMLTRMNPATTLVYICNPNNPTGTLTPRKDLEEFLGKLPATTYVVIDEAYHHFAEPSANYVSFIDRPVSNPRVIVARTFSKVYGMAGMRLGYAISDASVCERLRPQVTQDNVNASVARGAIAALNDTASLRTAIKRNADDRQEFINEAQGRALKPLPSHTNFVMMDTTLQVAQVIEHFKKHKILVGRPFPPMNTYLRVSLGTPKEILEFWRVWDLLGVHPQHH